MNKHKAFSLLELMTGMGISMILLSALVPGMSQRNREIRFRALASEVTDQIILARRHARMVSRSVRLLMVDDGEVYFRVEEQMEDGHWREISKSRIKKGIRHDLPDFPLEHPTTGRVLDKPLSSTHRPAIIFAPDGSSSASLVFSDGDGRAYCAVISSRTGRIRAYNWSTHMEEWQVFF